MLKANELRIGNLVRINNQIHRKKDTDKTFHILKIDSENDSCNGVCIDDMPYAECFGQFLKYIEPIPLTENWLIKCGFVEVDNNIFQDDILSKSIRLSNTGIGCYISDVTPTIEYVHQLQNLYFVLTGSELQVNVA